MVFTVKISLVLTSSFLGILSMWQGIVYYAKYIHQSQHYNHGQVTCVTLLISLQSDVLQEFLAFSWMLLWHLHKHICRTISPFHRVTAFPYNSSSVSSAAVITVSHFKRTEPLLMFLTSLLFLEGQFWTSSVKNIWRLIVKALANFSSFPFWI